MTSARRTTLGALGAGVLALHVLLFTRPAPAPLEVPASPAVLAVREVVAEPPPRIEPVAEPPARPPQPAPRRPAAKPRVEAAPPLPAEAPESAPPPSRAPPADGKPADAPPVYATRFAPPSLLRYRLRRGAADGEVELEWQPDGERYAARFAARLDGTTVIAQTSTGGFDAAGLAPQRFVDRRRRGAAAAANFQRDRGIVSYSGPTVEHPLPAGAQDRLSWMFQLAAVVDARPALAAPGGRILLPVFGARGDAGTWLFRAVDGAAAEGGLVHMEREAGGPYDAAVEVWLDPRRHHLPARIVLHGVGEGRPAIELALESAHP